MAILQECPTCHKRQTNKNKVCKCGNNLDKSKRSKKIRYWIAYRLPDGKQRFESVAKFEGLKAWSIQDAETALSKRTVQKAENRLLDIVPDSNITFAELIEWFLDLDKVKSKAC